MKIVLTFSLSLTLGKEGPCPDNQIAVVGGGLAGLAAAASLSKAGFDVVLLEAANYLGKFTLLASLSQTLQPWQQECHQTKDLLTH